MEKDRQEAFWPVLVGAAQVEQRPEDCTEAGEPLDLMIEAVRVAAPETAFASVLTPPGKRAWAVNRDTDVMQAMTREEFVGKKCTIGQNGILEM